LTMDNHFLGVPLGILEHRRLVRKFRRHNWRLRRRRANVEGILIVSGTIPSDNDSAGFRSPCR
jgi:hypothetical protein